MRILKYPILLTLLIISLPSHAQQFQGGMLLGISGSQLDGDSYSGYHKAGFQGGFFVKRQLSNFLDWQIEMKYIQKGAKKPSSDVTEENPSIYKVSLHYVEMPVLLQYNISGTLTAEAGFAVAYLFKATNDISYEMVNSDETPAIPFKKYDFSGIAGISYNINDNWKINMKFSYSLRPIRGATGLPEYYFRGGQFNNLLSFAVYYQFNLAK